MRGFLFLVLFCLMAVCGSPAIMPEAQAGPRTGKKQKKSRIEADKAYSLNDIMESPKEYVEREVFFYCRFATTANLFKNVSTRFNTNEHANFAVWPDKEVLWEAKGRKNVLPTLYIQKNEPELLDALRRLEKYDLIAVTGYVMNAYSGYPWILVTKLEMVQQPRDRLCPNVVEHMQSGHEALTANAGGVAARHYEQALQFGLPPEYRAKAYEQLARAYLLDNQLDNALTYLRLAVEADNGDPVLHLALADVALRMEDPEEAIAHCTFALERSGKHPQVYGVMGEAKSLMGGYVDAYRDLNAAAGTPGITAREKAMVNVRRARIYTRAGRHPDAARVYAAVSEPGEALAGEAWLHNEIGLFYEMLFLDSADARYLDSAYMAYEEASRLNRLEASYLSNMTEIEFRRQAKSEKPDYTLVRDLIEKINQVEPEYTPSRILEGRMLFAEGKPDEAEYRYQSVSSQIGGDASSLMALAEAYMDLGRFIDAASAVRRARNLQPWNLRVQALGKNLEKLAEEVERTRAEAMQQAFPPDPSTYSEPWQREESHMLQQQGGNQGYYEEIRHAPDPRIHRPQAPIHTNQARRPGGYEVRPTGGDPRQRPDVQRQAPQATYIPVDGRMVSVRPGEAVRAGADGQVRAESGNRVREIQAAATPSSPSGMPLRPYPATEVDLSRANGAEVRPAPAPGITNHTGLTPLDLGYTPGNRNVVGDGEGTGGSSVRPAESGSLRPGPTASAAPAPETARRDGGALEAYGDDSELVRYDSSHQDRYDGIREEQGHNASRRRADQRYESRYDSDDYGRRADARSEGRRPELYNPFQDPFADSPADRRSLRPTDDTRQGLRPDDGHFDDRHDLGQIPGVEGAYASLQSWEADDMNSGAGSVPKAFNFDPDFSPVIIADMRSPSRSGDDMPVRNPNLYRRRSGDRRPAEIIEKDPVSPREARDESGMAPADDGKVRRAEVKLPSSSQGVGMTSDYSWDR